MATFPQGNAGLKGNMRLIGYIQGADHARTFGDFLYAQGIGNQVDREQGDRFEVWIQSEDQVERGKDYLREFQSNPKGQHFVDAASKAKEQRLREALEKEAYAKKVKDSREITNPGPEVSTGRLTLILMVICGVVFLLQSFWNEELVFKWLGISKYQRGGGSLGLPEVRQGQVWRVITPIFMHGSFIHIFFNLMWMRILGTIIEYRQGWKWLLVVVIVTGGVSNLAQYYISGPMFYGISGVVFGLLGYIWMKGKFDPLAGMFMPQGVVFMMLLWLGLGVSGALEAGFGMRVANTAHIGGLLAGCLLGLLNSLRRTAR